MDKLLEELRLVTETHLKVAKVKEFWQQLEPYGPMMSVGIAVRMSQIGTDLEQGLYANGTEDALHAFEEVRGYRRFLEMVLRRCGQP